MTRITPAKFDGMTIEDRDAWLERRDQEERRRALSVAKGKGEAFMSYARELVRNEPSLIFDFPELAERVAAKCRDAGVTNPRGGEPYSAKTAYNYLTENRLQVLGALAGEIPAGVD